MTYLSVFFPAAVSAQALPAWQVCVFLLWCTVPPAAVLLAAFTAKTTNAMLTRGMRYSSARRLFFNRFF